MNNNIESLIIKMFYASPIPFTIANKKSGIWIETNDAFCSISEYSRDEIIGHSGLELNFLDPESRAKVLKKIQQQEELTNIEMKAYSKSGREIFFLATYVEIEMNNEIFIAGIMRDITDRKQAEKALQVSEMNLCAVVENSPDTIYKLDLVTGKASFLNQMEFCGYAKSELEGPGSILAAVHPDDIKKVKDNWQEVIDKRTSVPIEYRLRKKDGDFEWIEQRIRFLNNKPEGSGNEFLVTLSIVTRRKQSEEALQARERRFSQLIKNSFDTIVILDSEGIQRYVSESAVRVHGYTPSELVDIPVIERLIHPDDRERVLAAFRQMLKTGAGGVQYRHRRKAGGVGASRGSGHKSN